MRRIRLSSLLHVVVILALIVTLVLQERRIARLEAVVSATLPPLPTPGSDLFNPTGAVLAPRPSVAIPDLPPDGPSPFDAPDPTAMNGGRANGGPRTLPVPTRALPSPSRPLLPSERPIPAAAPEERSGKAKAVDATAPPPPELPR